MRGSLSGLPLPSPASPRSRHVRPRERHGCHQIRQTASVRSPWRCFLPSTLNTLSHTLCLNLTAPEMHACGMRHAPRLSTISFNKSFSTSAEREEVSLCTCTPVVLGKGAMSSVVQVLLFLFRQWRFPPRPISSHRATPFRLSRRMGGGVFFSFVGHANLAVVAKRSTLGQEKTTNNGHSQIACASRLNRVNSFSLFNIRQWLGVCFPPIC